MNCSIPAGPSGDCIPLKRIKTEPPDGEIIQVTVPGECAHARQPLALKIAHFLNYKHSIQRCSFQRLSLTYRSSVVQWYSNDAIIVVYLTFTLTPVDCLHPLLSLPQATLSNFALVNFVDFSNQKLWTLNISECTMNAHVYQLRGKQKAVGMSSLHIRHNNTALGILLLHLLHPEQKLY